MPGFPSQAFGAITGCRSGDVYKEKELGDGGDGTSYYVFRDVEFLTRTGKKIRED